MKWDELKKAAKAATPGPWKWDGDPSAYDQENESPWLVDAKGSYPPVIGGTVKCAMSANAAYIAAANPAAILELLSELRRLSAELEALKKAISDAEPVAHAIVKPLQPDEFERRVVVKLVTPVTGPLYTLKGIK